jgi:DNA-binding CsgD family transcriptional regulator
MKQLPVTLTLLGRDEILDSLTGAVADGQPVLIDGEMGVGKSTALSALSDRLVADGRTVARVFGAVGSRGLPLVPFGHLLAGWQPSNTPGQIVLELLAEIERRATTDRLVLLVDDVPYLDDASLAVVHQIAARASVPLVMTQRLTDELPVVLEELRTAGRIRRERLLALDKDLTLDLVGQIAGAKPDLVTGSHIWATTRGNPLFIRELIADGLERGYLVVADGAARWSVADPATDLRRTVAARLGSLDAEELDAFRLISLFEAAPAKQLGLGVYSSGCRRLETRGLIRTEWRGRRSVLVPSHPLFAEVIRQHMGSEASAVWRRLATMYETLPGRRADDVLQSALAALRSEGEVSPELLLAGAAVAMSRLAMPLVIELAGAAQALHPTAMGVALLGSAYFGIRDPASAAGAFKGALGIDATDAELADIALAWTITLFFGVGDVDGTREIRDLFQPRVVSQWRHQISVIDTVLECYAGSMSVAAAMTRSVHAAADAPDRAVLWHTFPGSVAVCFNGAVREALTMIARAEPFARAHSGSVLAAENQLATLRNMVLVCDGQVALSTGDAQRDLYAALERNDGVAAGLTAPCLAFAAWLSGEAPRIDLIAIKGIWEFGIGSWFDFTRYLCAATHARRGRVDLALECVADAPEDCMAFSRAIQHVASAEIALASGEPTEGMSLLELAAAAAAANENRFFQWIIALRLLGLRAGTNDLATVRELGSGIDSGLADLVAPVVADLASGPSINFVASVERLLTAGYRSIATDLLLAGAHKGSRPTVSAQIRTMIASIVAHRAAPAQEALGWQSLLTAAESRVALLVAGGLANKGIAQSLGISSKTVEFHVTSILRKLGADRRSQLVRILVESGMANG